MNIEGIINVSGKPGLHKIISRGKNTIIVESLLDKKRMPVYPHTPANALEEISIYTYEDIQEQQKKHIETTYRSISNIKI